MRNILKTGLTFLILLVALSFSALAQDGTVVKATVDYTGSTDVTGFMQRLSALLTSPEWFGSNPTLAPMIKELQDSGKLNLTGCNETLKIDQDAVRYTLATHYAGLAPDSFKGKLYAMPNRPLDSAQYVSPDAAMYIGLNNVPSSALLIFHWLVAHPEALENGPLADLLDKALSDQLGGEKITPEHLQQAAGLLDASGIEGQINATLSGEVAAAVFDADVEKLAGSDSKPQDIDLLVFLGLKDSAAVETLLTNGAAQTSLKASGEANGWKLFAYTDQPGVGLALKGNMLVGATRFDGLAARLASTDAKLSAPDCQYYMRFNLDKLLRKYAEPLATQALNNELNTDELRSGMDQQGLPSLDKLNAAWNYLLGFDQLGDLGALTLSGKYDNGYACEATLKPEVFMYGLYQLGRVGGVAAIQQSLKRETEQVASNDIPNGDDPSGTGGMAHPDMAPPADTQPMVLPGGDDEMKSK